MPAGIIMQSASVGATKEAIEKVLAENGHEPETPEVEVLAPVEPKREDFKPMRNLKPRRKLRSVAGRS